MTSNASDTLTLSWQRWIPYRNQSIDLQNKSIDWFLYDRDLRHERLKDIELHNFENKNFNPYSTNVPPLMDKSGS